MRMSSIPELFRCPISLDLFTDPVTLCTGQTYDRPSIERWLAGGNLTCPVTMQRLRDTTLVPNHTLRHLIQQWLLSTLNAVAHSDPMLELIVLRKVKALVDESDKARGCLLDLGFLPLLLRSLSRAPRQPEELTEAVLGCITHLTTPSHMGHFNVLLQEANNNNMAAMVDLIEHGGLRVKAGVCDVISLVAGSPFTRELCLAFGRNRRVVRVLVSLLGVETTSMAASRALVGLCGAAAAGMIREVAVEEGEGLLGYLSSGSRRAGGGCREREGLALALALLEQLARVEGGREKLVRIENGIRVLVTMVFRVSSDDAGSEHAVGCLWAACCVSERARTEAVAAGALSQLLLLLQSQCGWKAKAKARALLKLLSCSAHT